MRFDSDFNKTTNDACNLIYDQSEELKKLPPEEKDKILNQCNDAKVKLLNYKAKSYNYSQHIPRPVYSGAFKKDTLTGEDAKGASTVMCTELDQLQGKCVPIKYYVPEKPTSNFNHEKEANMEEIKMGDIFSNTLDKQEDVPLVVKLLGDGVGFIVNSLGHYGSEYLIDNGLPGIEWYNTKFSAKYFPNDLDTNMENANKLFANPIGNLFIGGGTCNVGSSDCQPLGSNYVIENEQNGETQYIPVNNIPLGNARGLIPSISEDILQTIEFPLKMVGILKSTKQNEYHIGSYNEINPSDEYLFILYCSQMEQLMNQILNGKNFTVLNGKEYYINILKKKLEKTQIPNIANFYSDDYDENLTYNYLKNNFDTFKKECGLITGISDFPITKCCLYFYSNIIPDSLHGEYGVPPLDENNLVILEKIFKNEKLIQYLKRFLFPFNPNLFKNRIFVPHATSCPGALNSKCSVNGQICTALTRTETKHGKSVAGKFKMLGGLITNLFGEITGDSDKVLEDSTICLDNVLKIQPTFDVAQVGNCSGKYCIVADQVCSLTKTSCVSGERQDSKYTDNLKAFKYILDKFKTEYKNTYTVQPNKPNKPTKAGVESFSSGEVFTRDTLTIIFYILLFILFIYLIYNAQK